MCNIRPSVCYVPPGFRQNALMIIAVQQGVLDITLPVLAAPLARGYPVCLQTSPFEDHEQPALTAGCRRSCDVMLHGQHMRVVCVLHGGGCVQIFLRQGFRRSLFRYHVRDGFFRVFEVGQGVSRGWVSGQRYRFHGFCFGHLVVGLFFLSDIQPVVHAFNAVVGGYSSPQGWR